MKKLLVALMILGIAITVMAASTTDSSSLTLNVNIESICWLTIDNDGAAAKSWTIQESDLNTNATSDVLGTYNGQSGLNAAIDGEKNILGVADGQAGNPLSYAVFATDAVSAMSDAANVASGLRVAVDSNDIDGYAVTVKADAAAFTSGTISDTIPAEQVSWWSHAGQYDGVQNQYASNANGTLTYYGSYNDVGPAHYATGKHLTQVDQKVFEVDSEGANVSTVNFGLALYTLDAYASDYTLPITFTATNK